MKLTINTNLKTQSGQALVTLLFFIIISVTLTTAAIIVIVVNSKSITQVDQANFSRSIAESGVENALLRLLRNPGYTGETVNINGGNVTVQVTSNGTTYTITSVGKIGFFVHTIQAIATMTNDTLTVASWKEI